LTYDLPSHRPKKKARNRAEYGKPSLDMPKVVKAHKSHRKVKKKMTEEEKKKW